MATIAETIAPVVAEALTVTDAKPAPRKPRKPAPAPTVEAAKQETDAAIARDWKATIKAIKSGLAMDTRKVKTLEDAKLALLKVRVNIVRDTSHAMTFTESHAKAGKTAGKPSQSVVAEAAGINRLTFAPYWKAAADYASKFSGAGEPTAEELDYVASFWKSEALRKQEERKADKAAPKSGPVEVVAEGDTEAAPTDGRPSVPAMPTQADVIAAVEALQAIVNGFTRDGGFADIVADNLQEVLAEIGTTIDTHRVGGASK